MTTITVAGQIASALTHFSGLGLAAIIESSGMTGTRIWWTDEDEPQLCVDVPNTDTGEISASLSEHVQHMSDPSSWVQRAITHEGRADTGLFSPRIKPPSSAASWLRLEEQRHDAIDNLLAEHDMLSLSMIGSLGEPAHWRYERNQNRPDEGASRWEMKTRNRGEEFISNRLAPMATLLSQRTPEELLDGVTGRRTRDDVNDSAESRSATGLQRPGPVDTARAWTALWGITSFPVLHRAHNISATAGAFPQDRLHTQWLVLPVFSRPVSLERWRAVISSEPLAVLGRQIVTAGEEAPLDTVATTVLVELGVAATGIARVHLGGSSSAPERMVLDVSICPLGTGSRYGS